MKFWVGVTDNRWFSFLRGKGLDEVNFWQPSARPMFLNIDPGTPFFFKLKRPLNHIGGYGTFVSFVRLPLALAWETFGEKNGASSRADFEAMIRPLSPHPDDRNPEVGCTLLANPEAGYSLPYLARARLGQGTFRALITDAYARRCAITGENILPVLEAAHIKPFSEQGPHKMTNGLLLRSDFHRLFDLGYLTVTPELRVEVSRRIQEEWFNGKAYYRLHGESLASVPKQPWLRPGKDFLQWHNDNRFQA